MNNLRNPFDLFGLWRRWVLGWIPFYAASYMVIAGAIAPADEIPSALAGLNDKAVHAAQYFLLFFFTVNAFAQAKTAWIQRRFRLHAWMYCLMVGVVTELLQAVTPDRTPDLRDWAADMFGSSVALGLFWLVYYHWRQSDQGGV